MRFIAALFTCLFTSFASATTVTTDFTDMWWVPAESGWGANVIQQGDTMFVTLFVYGPTGQPTWYVGPATTHQGVVAGAQRFTGILYRVTGPYFGAPNFNANSVDAQEVGSITFTAPFVSSATLTYSVDGVNVTKEVVRQTWRTESVAGNYIGATIGTFTGCASNGASEVGAAFGITQTGTSVVINEAGSTYTCRYTGTLTQTGRMGSISGTGTCSDLGANDFAATEVQAGLDFISMRMDFNRGTCRFSGRLGGMRR
jgi:hypothetical protein